MLVLPPPILMLDGENGGDMDTQSPTSKEVLEETSSTERLLDETGTYFQLLKTIFILRTFHLPRKTINTT